MKGDHDAKGSTSAGESEGLASSTRNQGVEPAATVAEDGGAKDQYKHTIHGSLKEAAVPLRDAENSDGRKSSEQVSSVLESLQAASTRRYDDKKSLSFLAVRPVVGMHGKQAAESSANNGANLQNTGKEDNSLNRIDIKAGSQNNEEPYLEEVEIVGPRRHESTTMSIQPLPAPTSQPDRLPGAYAEASPVRFHHVSRRTPLTTTSQDPLPEQQPPQDAEGRLTVAEPIEESERLELPHAEPHSSQENVSTTRKSTVVVGAFWLVFLIALIVVMALNTVGGSEDRPKDGLITLAPTTSPPITPEDRLEQVLPMDTVDQSILEPSSPQAQAYRWLLEDTENLSRLSNERLKQRFGLVSIYYAMNGDEWFNNSNWLDHGVHECYWWSQEGYQSESDSTNYQTTLGNFSNPCELQHNETAAEDTVYKHIWLFNNNLQGTIPKELLLITSLRSFVLEDNSVSGSIPPQLGRATNLQVISLASTQLTGSIPTELGRLSSTLESLNFLYSGIGGPLPSELGQLTKMTSLLLEFNYLTGTLPLDICQIQTLGDVWLAGNNLEGSIPACLGNLPSIGDEVYLEDNLFTGTLPSTFGQPNNLKILWVKGNLLTGSVPSELGLPNLEVLRMEGNMLTGSIPTELGSNEHLNYWDISANQLSGPMPSELGNLSNLQWLFLHDSGLTGLIPSQLGQCSNIIYLSLYENNLGGPIPSQIGQLEYIYDLWLDSNQLTGTLPTELGLLGVQDAIHLPRVYLEHNQLSGTIPTEFGQSTLLFELSLASNDKLTGPVSSELGQLWLLEVLKLHSCQLTGVIPSELGLMTSLSTLELHNNPLTGTVPKELGWLNLTHFNASSTLLTGMLPTSFCSAEVLDFDCSESLCGCDCPCTVALENRTIYSNSLAI